MLACISEFRADKWNPFRGGDFLQKHHIPEFVERHTLVVKNIFHEMLLAAKHAICHLLLMLPYRTQHFLKCHRIAELRYLLELINICYEWGGLLLCR